MSLYFDVREAAVLGAHSEGEVARVPFGVQEAALVAAFVQQHLLVTAPQQNLLLTQMLTINTCNTLLMSQ